MKPDINPNSLNGLKRNNRREVLDLVRRSSPISIADIAGRTSLSKVTVTKILDHYRRMGLIAVSKAGAGEERGKRPQIFAVNPNYKFLFCVKMDGYSMLATLTDIQGKVFASHTALYDKRIELPQLIRGIADAFHMLVEREGRAVENCLAIVAGLHGVIDPESGVCFLSPQFIGWGKNIPLRDMLAAVLPPGVRIYVDNWGHYYGRGEATLVPPGVRRFMLITTEKEGVNGAFMEDGKYQRGLNCLASEIGHMIVDTSSAAEICQCGGKGCLEASVSPRRMLDRVHKRLRRHPESPLRDTARREGRFTLKDVGAAADAGDELARSEFAAVARHFAVAIRNIMQTNDPELVVFEGEYVDAGAFFLDEVRAAIPRTSLLELDKTVQVHYSTLGQFGAIIGAAQFALDLFFAEV